MENMNNRKMKKEVTGSWVVGLILGIAIYAATKDIIYVSLGLTLGIFIGCAITMFTSKKNENTEEKYVEQLHKALENDDSIAVG